ncbi:2-oxoacid:ferredoxin oxidoreductase subunit beta [Klenkia brasiliensis]|uniref:2-oxoglutarate ferredoxin oxidoreductase subunit beta n=1 Tax=Klenkia brasiliensis TaxID=333142 RepID=A0A1G7R1S6_9ACTN|nr:2-oxoacid:ferredoxin oxidoreductase subunit beta [Klenkia brasiliensis]SDG04079.1 2-oxoglutarate ferredoxin oxidoreductase subunit beta [Klenkia brasiliensis]
MTTSPIDEHVHELGMPAFDQRIADAVARSVELGGDKQTSLKAKDLKTDQEVRWCPGCGDYVILNAVQSFLPSLGIAREDMVIVSGIGCSSRFPYYMNTYGMHSIHGRAPAIATGLAASRPDLSVWVVTGDGDALSIGGNHLIHTLRRNVNLTILLFNNRIYGLTKGQYSPTSELGKVTKSTPMGSLDHPFNPVSLALGADATFVGRAMDSDRKGLTDVLRQAAEHQGTALVEIYQNCNIFNDGAFELLKDPLTGTQWSIPLVHGEKIVFGPDGASCVVADGWGGLRVAETNSVDEADIVVHDAHREDPAYAFALSRLSSQDLRYTPMGVFRSVAKPTYDAMMTDQLTEARSGGAGDLDRLLHGSDTWTVEA